MFCFCNKAHAWKIGECLACKIEEQQEKVERYEKALKQIIKNTQTGYWVATYEEAKNALENSQTKK